MVNARDLPAQSTVDNSHFEGIDRIMEDLLAAACGPQYFEKGDNELGFLAAAMGKHIQNLRNELAQQLEPIFEAYGVQPVGY